MHLVKHNGWRNSVALDESWFDCHSNYESLWLSGDEDAPETER
jgi:hypothetical protein